MTDSGFWLHNPDRFGFWHSIWVVAPQLGSDRLTADWHPDTPTIPGGWQTDSRLTSWHPHDSWGVSDWQQTDILTPPRFLGGDRLTADWHPDTPTIPGGCQTDSRLTSWHPHDSWGVSDWQQTTQLNLHLDLPQHVQAAENYVVPYNYM
jgi:hypothetical protein